MSGRKLAVNTTIGGVTYEAGSVPPAEVAKLIENPKSWGDEPDDVGDKPARKAPAKSPAAKSGK